MTPKEIGRLMGVNDNDIDIMLLSGLSDHSLYKLFGNSIVVDCMTHIFNNLFFHNSEDKNVTLW